jgi:hypothetical protein
MLTPDVTDRDIGRVVIYRDRSGYSEPEEGVISSFNPNYVFVRYLGSTSAATQREDLEWADPPTDTGSDATPAVVP